MEKSTERLTELFEKRFEQLQQFLVLAQTQMEIVDTQDSDELSPLLAKKQRLLDAMRAMEAEFSLYTQDDPEERIWSHPDRRAYCQSVAEKCNELFRDVQMVEQQAISKLEESRQIVQDQMRVQASTRAVQTAYAQQEYSNAPASHLDLTSDSWSTNESTSQ